MKALISGDWHLTDKQSVNRIDNYEEALFKKLKFISKTAQTNHCDCIIQPGDFFNQPNPSYEFFSKVIDLVKNMDMYIYTIMGQHDLKYRNAEDTALVALEKACPTLVLLGITTYKNDCCIHGCSWGDPIPEPDPNYAFNILVIHKMIVERKLWEEQEDFEYGELFLAKYKYDLIVSGDNHKAFHMSLGKRYLFNCGSLMRSSIDQADHNPVIHIFDTKDPLKTKMIHVPCEPSENIFKFETVVKDKERNEKLEAFVSGLTLQKEMGLDFENDLVTYESSNKIEDFLIKIRQDCMR